MRAGYFGPEGTYTQEALLADTAGLELETVPLPTIYDTVMAVHFGSAQRALVPIENSLEGGVSATLDALAFDAPDVEIVGETVLAIRNCLIARSELALDAKGRILGLKIDVLSDMGAYLSAFAPFIPSLAGLMAPGLYDIPGTYFRFRGLYSNTLPVDAYRGAGRPEAAYLIERLVDLARGLFRVFAAARAGHERQEPLTICFQQRLNPFSHGQWLSGELWPKGGEHTTHSWRIRVACAQIAFDDGPQSLTFWC